MDAPRGPSLSVWTRFSGLSLLALAIWSRAWIGLLCLIPLALAIVWMFVNPRVFKKPKSTRNWASKGVFGERIWAERNSVTIPEEFGSRAPNLANLYSSVGLLPLAYSSQRGSPRGATRARRRSCPRFPRPCRRARCRSG